jgi:hypothetical protein
MKWLRNGVVVGESGGAYMVLVGKPGGIRPNGNSRRREDNIKIDLQDVRSRGMDWIDLAPYGSVGRHM